MKAVLHEEGKASFRISIQKYWYFSENFKINHFYVNFKFQLNISEDNNNKNA